MKSNPEYQKKWFKIIEDYKSSDLSMKKYASSHDIKYYQFQYWVKKYNDTPIMIYDYKPSSSGKIPKEFLKDFSGYLHADDYSGYKLIEKNEDAKHSNTAKGLAFCNKLFDLDREPKKLGIKERYDFKQEEIKPIFDAFLTWLNQASINALPQSKYGKAMTYVLNQMLNLMHYLDKIELDIDNNRAERSIKPFVIGRKNWLFNHSVNGALASARLYSIVQTCLINNVNPYRYLDDTLTKLDKMTINQETDLSSLLP